MTSAVAIPTTVPKGNNDVLEYGLSWADWLNGDTISASTWAVDAGITKVSDNFTDTMTTIWLSGGTINTHYVATNHITTVGGREKDQSLTFSVERR